MRYAPIVCNDVLVDKFALFTYASTAETSRSVLRAILIDYLNFKIKTNTCLIGSHRPGSADSRSAWDNEGYTNDPGINTVSAGVYGKQKILLCFFLAV